VGRIEREAARRRTFAIISHPDAGKTTLTEKLLLYGGRLAQAGAVDAKRSRRAATSDWMEIERERGISVTSTILRFEQCGVMFNLLDTPGHRDFSEDTLRVLAAADAAVGLLDAARGVEPQTLCLFEVARARGIPLLVTSSPTTSFRASQSRRGKRSTSSSRAWRARGTDSATAGKRRCISGSSATRRTRSATSSYGLPP